MRKQLISAGLTIVVGALAVGVSASNDNWRWRKTHHVRAALDGYNETPQSLSTTGKGSFRAEIFPAKDMMEGRIEYTLSYEDLEGGAVTQAHIHLGQRHTSGGVSAFLCSGPNKPLCPTDAMGGKVTVTGTIVPADVVGPAAQGIAPMEFEELVRAIRSGAAYVNVHTTVRPSGEIRGQIQEILPFQFNNNYYNNNNSHNSHDNDHGDHDDHR